MAQFNSATFHGPLHTPFSSTLHNHEKAKPHLFNFWLVVFTAIIFFLVLSWYNVLSLFFSYFGKHSEKRKEEIRNETLTALGFALVWTLITLFTYIIMDENGLLEGDEISEHPILTSELKGI